ncbi:MAG: ABC transporter six-transmembrane domain-containing protein [Ignavibacteria bacterium]|jgi:ABC-type multidrug transport system fused ATPase/permease subunit
MNLFALVKRFRKGITLAIALVIIENIAWIVEPTLFGKVIDAVIDKALEEPESSFILPLVLWIGIFALNSGVGALRRSLDPRIFLNIFTNIAAEVSDNSLKRRLSVSKTAARAELSYQYISFFQYRVPEIIEQSVAIIGGVIALYFFDWRISVTCLFIIFPLIFISNIYNNKVVALQKEYHDAYEDVYDIFAKKDPEYIREYYNKLALPQRKIANWGAFNFGFVRVALLIIFLVVLYIAIDLDEFSAGELYSIVAYLWTFVTSTEYLPELMESGTSLKDISRRLKSENI